MTQNPDTYVDEQILKQAIADSGNLLEVPDGASVAGEEGEPGYKAVWNEHLDITKLSYTPSKKGTGWMVGRADFTVAPDVEGANAGRTFVQTWPIFPAAMSDRKHEYRGLTASAIKSINNFAEALGTSLVEAGSVGQFLADDSPYIGQRVVATISRYVKKNGDTEQSARVFSPVEAE